jgi:predicted polyphosphate/ATP-dependent NAD kinase
MAIPRIGFIVNPIAGMGGKVALKGTDGMEEQARQLGAKPVAPYRAKEFLQALEGTFHLSTCSSPMGEDITRECKIPAQIIYHCKKPTTPQDTKNAAKAMMNLDLLIFVGGDGTAQDIIDAIDMEIPLVGVPSGVKMYSAVFAMTPREAARVTNRFLQGLPVVEKEVLDIDEDAFRKDILKVSLKGYALVPNDDTIQESKNFLEGGEDDKIAIATGAMDMLEGLTIIGGGSTTYALKKLAGINGTLLGVDILDGKKLVAKDATENMILEHLQPNKKAKIIISPLGGQGFIFGRGNEQISPEVIKKVGVNNIAILSTPNKLRGLPGLRVDTGDRQLDKELSGYHTVYIGLKRKKVMKIL